MKKVLLIANYKPSVGGISGQVEILMEKFNFPIFNTKVSNVKRIFLPFSLFVKGVSYQTFHIHGCSGLGFFPIVIGVIVGRLLKKRIIITYHGGGLLDFINKFPKFVKFFLTKCDNLTVPSSFLSKILDENGISSIIIPNVMRTSNVTFKKRNKFFPKFVTTRSLEPVYNIPLVINAFKILSGKYADASLQIVGDGSLRSDLENMVKELDIKNVKFTGRVTNDKIGKILNSSDIYINPTKKDSFSVSMFEAFACGLPVISTNVGAIPDFLKDGVNGHLIESNNVTQLVDKIGFVLQNQENTKKMITNGFETFKKYTWNKLEQKYRKIYEEI